MNVRRSLPLVTAGGEWRRLQAQLAENRERTLKAIADCTPEELVRESAEFPNSISTQLAHLAAIEMDWLFVDLLNREIPADVLAWFPFVDVRDDAGRLSRPQGPDLADLIDLLHRCRERWIRETRQLDEALLVTQIRGAEGSSNGEWILTHLLLHEAEHRGMMRRMLSAMRG